MKASEIKFGSQSQSPFELKSQSPFEQINKINKKRKLLIETEINICKIQPPELNINIIENIYKSNKIVNYKDFLSEYYNYLLIKNDYLSQKDSILNFLNIFRFYYKILVIEPSKDDISALKNRYEYCYKQYKDINDESIFPSRIIKEMELIANSF
jgi:hypothetical protein